MEFLLRITGKPVIAMKKKVCFESRQHPLSVTKICDVRTATCHEDMDFESTGFLLRVRF